MDFGSISRFSSSSKNYSQFFSVFLNRRTLLSQFKLSSFALYYKVCSQVGTEFALCRMKNTTKNSGKMSKFSIGFPLILIFLLMDSGESVMKPEIGGDTLSTLRLVYRLCFVPGDHSNRIAKPFFGCYDQAPGKPLFVHCQKKVIGRILNTKENIDVACSAQGLLKLPQYAMCIQRSFKKAGMSMPIAVTKLNVCQGKVLGIK